MVLIYLGGGNDGLNTIIPLNQYDLYSNLRPTIKIPDTGLNSYINLDLSLDESQQIGLHPSLTKFKDIYDAGNLRILQSVGYPSQNKSHFASTDIYNTGNDGNSWLNGGDSGWIGRFIESYFYDLVNQSFPIGVEIGSKTGSLGFHGAEEHGLSLNIEGQDASGFYSVLSGLGGSHLLIYQIHIMVLSFNTLLKMIKYQLYTLKQSQMHLIVDQILLAMRIQIYQIN